MALGQLDPSGGLRKHANSQVVSPPPPHLHARCKLAHTGGGV
jgi:hypothetical protein